MTLLESLPFDGSDGLVNVEEYVDPQYTVIGYATTQLGVMTPASSSTDTTPRRESFALSDSRSTSFCGSSAASSMSYSRCRTPSSSTPGSSASNSRRQSMLLPESQQGYLSAISSSPSNHSQGQKMVATTDQWPLQEFSPRPYLANTDTASLINDCSPACMTGCEFTMAIDSLTGHVPRQWRSQGPQSATPSQYSGTAQAARNGESISQDHDLMALCHPLFDQSQPTIFANPPSQPVRETYDDMEGNAGPNAPSLAPPFEPVRGKYDTDVDYVDMDMASRARTFDNPFLGLIGQPSGEYFSSPSDDDPEYDPPAPRIVKKHNRMQRQRRSATSKQERKSEIIPYNHHKCTNCKYSCNRPEHLKRHQTSVHWQEYGDAPDMLPCAFDGCKDRAGRHRGIIARFDNLKAHYTKTHFKYGGSEKGGKNERKSMKAAHEMGLNGYDFRWTLLLQGTMDVNREIKDYLHVWKMLGYSILETRDTKVKDVVPDVKDLIPKWPEPEDATLQKFDPRWKALWDGTLTFDKAISNGKDMKESDAQGLLGVTMLETEAMGIGHLDPRWKVLLGGRMSVEQSEKLGVKQRNPVVAKRKIR